MLKLLLKKKKKVFSFPSNLKNNLGEFQFEVTPWALYLSTRPERAACPTNTLTQVLIKPDDFLAVPETKAKLFIHLEKYHKDFLKLPPNILTELMLAVIYLKMDNQDGAEALIKRSLSRDPQKTFFNHCVLPKKSWENNKSAIIGALSMNLKFIKDHLKNTLLADMFIHYFMLYGNEDLNQALKLLTDFNPDKATVEKELKGVKEGKRFFPFWYFLLYSRMSEKEKYDLADKYFDHFLIRNYFEDVGWVFMSYFPADEEVRKIIIDQTSKLHPPKTLWQADLWVKLLGQEVIKRKLEKAQPEIEKPIFIIRRKVYADMLSKKEACAYAFFQLVSLGDEQKEYLEHLRACQD